jgi:molybdenum cofactor cytidylyltransferase
MSVAGLILAAGESRRMGSPKPLLMYHGRTFLETLIALFTPRCGEVIVVLGAHVEQIAQGTSLAARFVVNADYTFGQTSSLQCGLRALNPESEGVLMTLVDHPAVLPATLDALLASPRPLLRVPRHGGRRGHPLWFARELVKEFLALDPAQGARDVVRAHAEQTEFLDVDDPGILIDVDDPTAYARIQTAGQPGYNDAGTLGGRSGPVAK